MRIIDTTTKTTIGTVTTNHSMTLEQACAAVGVDLAEHDIEDLRLSMYSEFEEVKSAEECGNVSCGVGLVDGKIPTDADGEPTLHAAERGDMLDGDYSWLKDKFGHVTDSMIRAYVDGWNARLAEASAE